MKPDKHGCKEDALKEAIFDSERRVHEDKVCNPVTCVYCIEDREDREEAEREERDKDAYYDWWGIWRR